MIENTNTIILEKDNANSIQITWVPENQELEIRRYDGVYFNKYVQLEESPISLAEFFIRLGITREDVDEALKVLNRR